MRAGKPNWRLILTGDESWFFYWTPNSTIWLHPDFQAPEVARQLINTLKIIVTMLWNPSDLSDHTFMEIGTSFNSTYFTEYVLSDSECLSALQTVLQ
jgi:hypothetical protein